MRAINSQTVFFWSLSNPQYLSREICKINAMWVLKSPLKLVGYSLWVQEKQHNASKHLLIIHYLKQQQDCFTPQDN